MRVISSAVFARDSNSAVIIKGLEIDATRGVNSPSLFVFVYFARVCSQNHQIRKQSRENVLAFVSFCLRLFLYLLKKGTNAGKCSRFCLSKHKIRKQSRESVPAFVYQMGQKGNKRGNRITLTRARLPRLFPKNQWRKDLKKFCVSGSVQASITSYGVPFSATTPFRSKTTLSAAS